MSWYLNVAAIAPSVCTQKNDLWNSIIRYLAYVITSHLDYVICTGAYDNVTSSVLPDDNSLSSGIILEKRIYLHFY